MGPNAIAAWMRTTVVPAIIQRRRDGSSAAGNIVWRPSRFQRPLEEKAE
jgi:hypothetical protein